MPARARTCCVGAHVLAPPPSWARMASSTLSLWSLERSRAASRAASSVTRSRSTCPRSGTDSTAPVAFATRAELPLLHLGVRADAGDLPHEHRLRQALVAGREDPLLALLQERAHLRPRDPRADHEEAAAAPKGHLPRGAVPAHEIELLDPGRRPRAAALLPQLREDVRGDDDVDGGLPAAALLDGGRGAAEEDPPQELGELAGGARGDLRAGDVDVRLEARVGRRLEELLRQLLAARLLVAQGDAAVGRHGDHLGDCADARRGGAAAAARAPLPPEAAEVVLLLVVLPAVEPPEADGGAVGDCVDVAHAAAVLRERPEGPARAPRQAEDRLLVRREA
eukprot:CAMPEP_0179263372 /NCGR_PEP_ID=MMETSP0797-20121207/27846_1 /TAXON_ID=47934 /ORGANISM="Dinophysis acuminata, Strain DAEP01" /LENGTH=337 /DNA_ID=CAMNT_0020971531 /DNA_START=20 /DNA_END=1030 /DNA_ORIENTATION=+